MRPSTLLSLPLAALAATAQGSPTPTSPSLPSSHSKAQLSCLCEDEAWDIARRWLAIFDTPLTSTKADLAAVVSANVTSYDDTFGPPTLDIDQLWDAITAPQNATTTNSTQTPTFLLHSCDQIAYNWQYTAVTTGYNSTVPAGTPVSFTGNDILRVDLKTRLISNATSCGDWILLSRQLGNSANV
ncbi:hypothetical protein CGLO_17371 [Colletotrichum gloeosporioides Cg-14]|uniref:NTF2-like domain-containing protein n=1 Tax=Colletotrichum gloeosporioides (strain Cg-14) TaxID=1237896 RepID=T0KX08_COLGC|nr:hypothetical protein CGLO_17371 [Colletotrichum gloeosporioides Cg-14]